MNNITDRFLTSSILIFLALLFTGCSKEQQGEQKTIILAHAMHATHPVTLGMNYMTERLEEISDGRLTVKTYPTSQLGGERELLELVQIGTVGITKVSGAALENIVPAARVFSLPYLFRDEEHYRKVVDGDIGREILDAGTAFRLKGIAYYDAGFRSFYTVDRPIITPDDLRGLKIRVQPSVMAINLIRAYGGSATPLAYGELYTAFQGGIVDGAENNPPSFYSSRHYEVTNYYIINEHTAVPDFLVISTPLWESLTEQEQQWLQEAIDESVHYQRVLWDESVLESMEAVKAAGVEVIYPDKEPFRERVMPIYDTFRESYPDLYQLVERIREIE
ncbi:MAG: TRAP transporter substrate-binding protein [Balneolaceae bacterium]|nr:MAG: TRAP transporter substrate-binding protein [Balneolaceae bacterium]